MINWDKINKKINVKKIILPLLMVILILLLIVYFGIVHKYICKNIFASKMQHISENNENPDFSIEKIYLCSSANGISNFQNQDLNNLNLYQYTDIAIYIKNNKEQGLNKNNTVKKLYIDDIDLELDNNNIGTAILDYTNLLKIGSKEQLENMIKSSTIEQKDKIDFNIITTNEQNNQANYEQPTFYADCSNPISLKYINQINKNYIVGSDKLAKFDGSLLQKAGIKIEDINVKIIFKINIVNNNDKYYSAWLNFRIPLNDIYKGTSIKSKNTDGNEYSFFSF